MLRPVALDGRAGLGFLVPGEDGAHRGGVTDQHRVEPFTEQPLG
jgi:hypothetical protein